MREVTASAPGKVNLSLRCGQPTPDGYHPLVTVFECLDVREYVAVRTSRSPGIRVTNTAYRPDGSVDHNLSEELDNLPSADHLAARAAKALQPLAAMGPWKATSAGLNIHVEKHIPVAGGMAGGSADAAATLVACNELWELGLSSEQLEAIGRSLGADVPACLRGGTTLGLGRGDHLTSLPTPSDPHHWVMMTAYEGLSTPEVFRALDQLGGPQGPSGRHAWVELNTPTPEELAPYSADSDTLAGSLVNDLYDAAVTLRPSLGTVLRAAREAGALAAILSGSGPTCAALARSEEHARELADTLGAHPDIASTLVTSGPAPGARIEAAYAN